MISEKAKVLDLANKINGTRTGQPGALTANDMDYLLIEPFLTEEMAEIGLCLKPGKPQKPELVAEKCGKPLELVKRALSQMAMDGIIMFVTRDGIDRYFLMPWVPGVYEMMVLNKENRKKYPHITRYFDEHGQRLGAELAPNIPLGYGLMRVVPVQKAVDGESRRASYEEIMNIMNKYDIFAAADCQCRISNREHGKGCGHTVEDMCLVFGPIAPYYIRTGRARQITKEEAFALMEKAENEGLIHQVPNIAGPDQISAVCNCCGCGCFMLRGTTLYNSPDLSRSNYVSRVDSDKCVACGQCVENCQVNALSLGQKLCSTDNAAPVQLETPYDSEWGPDNWNSDFQLKTMVAQSGTSPCKTDCPAHIAIQGYIKMAAQGRYQDALELIKEENPFPAICGRICPRNCESACTRAEVDEPIAIDEIKKFIAEQDLKSDHRFVPKKKTSFRPEKIAVVGAGPAGLSCAYFLAIEGYQVTVFEKQKVLGGMLTLGIPSFRLEKDIINAEIDILKEIGVEFKTGVEIGANVTLAELRKLGFKAFYLAVGAQASRKLGLEGEEAGGVMYGIEFLRQVNLHEKLDLMGPAIVIGGGNVAVDVARTAARIGGSPVGIYCLEAADEMPAINEEVEEALAEGIGVNNSWGPRRILQENGQVTGVEFKRCLSVFDQNGRFAPVFDDTETKIVTADHVLISVGQEMYWGQLLKDSSMELNPNQTIKVDAVSYQTADTDVFAGGDAVSGPKFAIDAIAMGKQGAISIHRYLHGDSLNICRDREYRAFDKENLDLGGYDRVSRQKPHHSDGEKTMASFKDPRVTLTEEQIKRETERCLGCGAVVLNEYRCLGCGICTTKCKFDAISLVKKYDAQAPLGDLMPGIMRYAAERYQRIEEKKAARINEPR